MPVDPLTVATDGLDDCHAGIEPFDGAPDPVNLVVLNSQIENWPDTVGRGGTIIE